MVKEKEKNQTTKVNVNPTLFMFPAVPKDKPRARQVILDAALPVAQQADDVVVATVPPPFAMKKATNNIIWATSTPHQESQTLDFMPQQASA